MGVGFWCAGKLGNCTIGKASSVDPANPAELKRFHFTCLYCRWRRRYLGKFQSPKYWIHYTYLNHTVTHYTREYISGGKAYTLSNGGLLRVEIAFTLLIDPRGHFTRARCACIQVLDKMIKLFHSKKPFVEFAEFFANYPTW